MKYLFSRLLALGLLLSPQLAHAERCAYTNYKPRALLNKVVDELAVKGFATAPGQYFGETSLVIVKNGVVTGYASFLEDSLTGQEYVTFHNVNDVLLASMKLEASVYRDELNRPVGRSNWVQVWTVRDSAGDTELPPFSMIDSPAGLYYWRFNRATSVSQWRYDIDSALDWLMVQLTNSAAGKVLEDRPAEDEARLAQAFAMQPALIPYLNRVQIQRDQSDALVLNGRVDSNAIYSLFLRTAVAEGLYVRSNLVIDSRATAQRTDLPALDACTL